MWIIWYHDTDVAPEIFAGYGAEEAARKRFTIAKLNWSCILLREVDRTG